MNSIIKTPEQVEFSEVVGRLKKAGLNQSAIARELKLSRSYVGMILKGQRDPSPRTMSDIRDMDASLLRDATTCQHGDTLAGLYQRLVVMEREDKPNFEVAKKIIETLAPGKKKPAKTTRPLSKSSEIPPEKIAEIEQRLSPKPPVPHKLKSE